VGDNKFLEMVNLDFEGEVEDIQKKGFYFRPKMHICKHYLIEAIVKTPDSNCLVIIYEIGIPQRIGGVELQISNGEQIATHETQYFCEIDLWGKYYFPRFAADQYQWYYNESYGDNKKWNQDHNGNMDEILAMAEVMKYAMELGLKIGNITLY